MFDRMRARLRGDRRRCPLCFDDLAREVATRACDTCGTSYHPACFVELGGCSTAGCAERQATPATAIRPATRTARHDDFDRFSLYSFAGFVLGMLVAYAAGSSLESAFSLGGVGVVVGGSAGLVTNRLFGRAAAGRLFGASLGVALGALLALIVVTIIATSLWDAEPPLERRSPLLVELPVAIVLTCGLIGGLLAKDPK